jgi:putative phosphoesterase
MKIAVFSDIHANILALNAVLEDIKREGLDDMYCLGDLVGYGPYPNQVIETIKDNNIETIMGNYDQGVGFDLDDCGCAYKTKEEQELGDKSLEWSKNEVTDQNKNFLKNLKGKIELEIDGRKLLLVHGSPRKINQYLFFDHPEKSLQRMIDQYEADILICGHTHIPYVKYLGDKLVINDGSVGKQKPYNENQELYSREAKYLLLKLNNGNIATEIRSIRYDYKKVASDIEKSKLPNEFAKTIRGGSKDGD